MLISNAYAQTAAAGGGDPIMQFLPLILMFVVLYFLMIRPQMKRAKEHKALVEGLQKGDEIVTASGIVGRVTKVDAVYDKDPKTNADARRFERLSYIDALNMRVGVMDSTAIAMCMDNDLPIYVVNLWNAGILPQVVKGETVGTVFSGYATA